MTAKRCACFPDGPFCGACAYGGDGELVGVRVHEPARVSKKPSATNEGE